MARRCRRIKVSQGKFLREGSSALSLPQRHRQWLVEQLELRIAASDFLGALIAPSILSSIENKSYYRPSSRHVLAASEPITQPQRLVGLNLSTAANEPEPAGDTSRSQLPRSTGDFRSRSQVDLTVRPSTLLAELWSDWPTSQDLAATTERCLSNLGEFAFISPAAYETFLPASGGSGGGEHDPTSGFVSPPAMASPEAAGFAVPTAQPVKDPEPAPRVEREPTVRDRFGLSWGELAVFVARKRGELIEDKGTIDEPAAFASLARHFRDNNVDKVGSGVLRDQFFAQAAEELKVEPPDCGCGGAALGAGAGAGCASGSFSTNLPPVAYDDWYITYQGSQLNVPANGVLANDCDPNLNSITAYRTFGPFYGSLTLSPNGSFQYTPNPGFSGYDGFWYRAFDGQLYSVDEAAVDIHVLGADIDTDSDNNGVVDLSAAEESIEMADPGKILMYNDDDDNSNGLVDRTERPTNPPPTAPTDDDLKEVRLQFNRAGLDDARLAPYYLVLRSPSPNLWYYSTANKLPLNNPTFSAADVGSAPRTIFVEGYQYGQGTLEWALMQSGGNERHVDYAKFTVAKPNLTASTPSTVPFQMVDLPESQEMIPGVGIRRNGDDDNLNQTADYLEGTSIAQEDDLIRVKTAYGPDVLPGVQLVLVRSTPNLRLWTTSTKVGPRAFDAANAQTVSQQGTYWTEWANWNSDTYATYTLQVRATNTNNVALTASMKIVPFVSVAIVLGGEWQNPSDPPFEPTNHGIYNVAIDEYRRGYDVHMYEDDDANLDGTGVVFDEIVRAIQQRGVQQVAIMGYSHGGGRTYDVAWQVNNDPSNRITQTFTIAFTGYVDAIAQPLPNFLAERRRPPGSAFHHNQYQRNDTLSGNSGAGDVELDRSALNVNHSTIDDHTTVKNALKSAFESRVLR